ncbi:MAG: hypothetical protein KDB86_00475 [Actinobacteria bacterium]|nr:hypothetical protein [Actinomycetota bacterium]MCB9388435.1 hypothetical protein [Acidimicrobiia bacterium]
MPTWDEVTSFVRERYDVAVDADETVGLVFKFEDGRTQYIGLTRFQAFDAEWFELKSTVCPSGEMSHTEALRKNAAFALGALALVGEDIVLVDNAPLATVDLGDLERSLHILAATADQLEKEFASQSDAN